jgi:aminoacylase
MNRNAGDKTSDTIKRLQAYLRIRSVQPAPLYKKCIDYLQSIGMDLGLESQLYVNNSKPLLVMTRKGTDPSLPSLLLTSHMDVVPVSEVHIIIIEL